MNPGWNRKPKTDGTASRVQPRDRLLDHHRHIEEIQMKKIVLTANDDRGLDGEMSMHFGHCTHFVVAHVDADNRVVSTEVHPNPYADRHEPGQIPQYINSLGADVVVAGGMGERPSSGSDSSASRSRRGRDQASPTPWTPILPAPFPGSPSAVTSTDSTYAVGVNHHEDPRFIDRTALGCPRRPRIRTLRVLRHSRYGVGCAGSDDQPFP